MRADQQSEKESMTFLGVLFWIFMFPMWIILAIFGRDTDTFRFYIGTCLILAYIWSVAIVATGAIIFIIISGFHMLLTILTWLP